MGRGKVEIKRIGNDASRRASFGKRSGGLLKKAHELAVLCDADLGVLVSNGAGKKQVDYCSPHTRSVRSFLPWIAVFTSRCLSFSALFTSRSPVFAPSVVRSTSVHVCGDAFPAGKRNSALCPGDDDELTSSPLTVFHEQVTQIR